MVASQSITAADADTAKKRKREEDREERRLRKKHKSKSKSHSKANASEADDVQPHGSNGHKAESLETISTQSLVVAQPETDSNGLKVAKRTTTPGDKSTSWRVSNPIGGRMLDIDPVFSADEE